MRRRNIGPLRRIATDVIEFRLRRIDICPRAVAPAVKRCPSATEPAEQRFEVRRFGIRRLTARGKQRRKASALNPWQRRKTREIQQRRRDVDQPDEWFDDDTIRDRRTRDNQRNTDRRAVDEKAVRRLAVLVERLAVIRGYGHDGMGGVRIAGGSQHVRYLRVDEGNLAVIRIAETIPKRFWRIVRPVWIEKMHPQQVRPPRFLAP